MNTTLLSLLLVALSVSTFAAQNVKSILGIPIANIKTVSGVPIANVKSISGVDNTSGGGACDTEEQTSGGADGDNPDFNSYKWLANRVTSTFDDVVCKVDVQLFRTGTPGGTVTAAIYTYAAPFPGTLIDESDPVNINDISTTGGSYHSFTGLSVDFDSATDYYLIIKSSINTTGLQWRNAGASADQFLLGSDNGGSSYDNIGGGGVAAGWSLKSN